MRSHNASHGSPLTRDPTWATISSSETTESFAAASSYAPSVAPSFVPSTNLGGRESRGVGDGRKASPFASQFDTQSTITEDPSTEKARRLL
jgi:hypothetical protein